MAQTFTAFHDQRNDWHFARLGFHPGDRAFCGRFSRPDRAVAEVNGQFIDSHTLHACKRCSGIANESRGNRGER